MPGLHCRTQGVRLLGTLSLEASKSLLAQETHHGQPVQQLASTAGVQFTKRGRVLGVVRLRVKTDALVCGQPVIKHLVPASCFSTLAEWMFTRQPKMATTSQSWSDRPAMEESGID
eukprot:63014-Pelagomonas_calceolata.AAC.2